MPNDKGTNVFSEIGKFFKEKDGTSAMNAIMDMMDAPQPVGKEAVRDWEQMQLQVDTVAIARAADAVSLLHDS